MQEISNETSRLATLQLYNVLDTTAESAFDDLTLLASTICEVPISLVSLIDESRQWFKSNHGLNATETPRSQAFCDHAIRADEVLVIEDALLDKRFANNPLVTGEPNIRFYAGAPLIMANGSALGTLCVIDRQPNNLTDMQLTSLGILRDAVVAQLELRRAVADIRALQHLIPMCAWCRNIRMDEPEGGEAWQPLHEYVVETNLVTHGICPTCATAATLEAKR